LVLARVLYEKSTVSFELPSNKRVLVIGDSHTECAINDTVLTEAFNFSRAGTAYFYSYLKVREILKFNPQIKTVVLGYSYKTISKYKDSWFTDRKYIKTFLPEHFFLLNFNDFYSLLKSNSYAVLISIPKVIFRNIDGIEKLGKYLSRKENNLDKAKKLYNSKDNKLNGEYSKYQTEYLLKINELVISKNVDLVLLNAPMYVLNYSNIEKTIKNYYLFAEQKLPKVKIINHSNFSIPDFGYRDLSHLNYRGAKLYSEYLRKHGFNILPND